MNFLLLTLVTGDNGDKTRFFTIPMSKISEETLEELRAIKGKHMDLFYAESDEYHWLDETLTKLGERGEDKDKWIWKQYEFTQDKFPEDIYNIRYIIWINDCFI